jgi:4-hydroxy-4-methyl-2-oxoglutarate aldolase
MSSATPQSLGKLPPEAIGMTTLPELPRAIIAGFEALPDLTGMTSDAMDDLGLSGVVAASILHPTDPSKRMVGRALTVKNIALNETVPAAVHAGISPLGEIEAHHLAQPGDILVLQGIDGISNMGGLSASIGHRQGEIGAIVDGAVRDIDHSRGIGYPIWSRSVSPITGKWRIETVAVNKPVSICGIVVNPGDLVLADEVGVCFIPYEWMAEVLARATQIAANERLRQDEIARGVALVNLTGRASR